MAETRSALQFDLEGDHQERSAGGTQDKSASDPAVQKTDSAAAAAPSARNRSLAAAPSATDAGDAAVAAAPVNSTAKADPRSLPAADAAVDASDAAVAAAPVKTTANANPRSLTAADAGGAAVATASDFSSLAPVAAKIVISDGYKSVVNPTSKAISFLQFK